jgi:hypothetical protein
VRSADGCAKEKPLQLGGRNGFWQNSLITDFEPAWAGKGTVPCSHRDDCAYAPVRLSIQWLASVHWLGFLEEDGKSCIYSDRSLR